MSTSPRKRAWRLVRSLLLLGLLNTPALTQAQAVEPAHPNARVIRLATTTSTDNSGLLNYLLPEFEQQGTKVQVIAVGTGKALQFGRHGDVDLLLTHAPGAENIFLQQGYAIQALPLMHNDFVLVGPDTDPADLTTAKDLYQALMRLYQQGATFLSRGDDSGTHKKELRLWRQLEMKPDWSGYRQVGQGMGRTLMMAAQLGGYTLADRGTWLSMRDQLPQLKIVFSGDAALFNPYRILLINPERHPHLNHQGARELASWLTQASTLEKIGQFKVQGVSLFVPIAADQRVTLD